MIRTGRLCWRALSACNTCRPFFRGSPRSSRRRSNASVRRTWSADSPSWTQSTVKPSRLRPVRIASAIMASSSTSSSRTSGNPSEDPLSPIHRLIHDAKSMAVELTEHDASRLEQLLDELDRWNRTYNLTAITKREEMVTHHLLDSLAVQADLHGVT